MLGIESNVFKPKKLTAWAWNGKAKTLQFEFFWCLFFPFWEKKKSGGQVSQGVAGSSAGCFSTAATQQLPACLRTALLALIAEQEQRAQDFRACLCNLTGAEMFLMFQGQALPG